MLKEILSDQKLDDEEIDWEYELLVYNSKKDMVEIIRGYADQFAYCKPGEFYDDEDDEYDEEWIEEEED